MKDKNLQSSTPGTFPKNNRINLGQPEELKQGLGVENNNAFISLAEASEQTGYHQDYLGFLCRKGKLKSLKIGRNWVTTQKGLDEYIKNYKNSVSEVTGKRAGKIKVHFEQVFTEDSAKPKQNSLRQEVLLGYGTRISSLNENLNKIKTNAEEEKLLKRQKNEFEETMHVLPIPEPVKFSRPALNENFISNFQLGNENLSGQDKVAGNNIKQAEILTGRKIADLYQSFAKPKDNKPLVFTVLAIALLSFLGSVLVLDFSEQKKLANGTLQKEIIYYTVAKVASTSSLPLIFIDRQSAQR